MTREEKAQVVFDAMSVIESVEVPCPLCRRRPYVIWSRLPDDTWWASCGHRFAPAMGYYAQ